MGRKFIREGATVRPLRRVSGVSSGCARRESWLHSLLPRLLLRAADEAFRTPRREQVAFRLRSSALPLSTSLLRSRSGLALEPCERPRSIREWRVGTAARVPVGTNRTVSLRTAREVGDTLDMAMQVCRYSRLQLV
jgi:hypothetical protein